MATTIAYFDIVSEAVTVADDTLHTVTSTADVGQITNAMVNNPTTTVATITINLVQSGGTLGVTNQYVTTATIPAKRAVVLSEIIGRYLKPGDFISVKASVASVLNLTIALKEIST